MVVGEALRKRILDLIDENIENLTLILVNEEEQLEYNLKYEIKESEIFFTTCEYINKGINLEKMCKEKYAFLLKYKNKYYSFKINNVKIN